MSKKHWCDECGSVAVDEPFEVCATCSHTFEWNGRCLACCGPEPEQKGCVYCNECIALLAGLEMKEACQICFGNPRGKDSLYCEECSSMPKAEEYSWWGEDYDDEYYADERGYGFAGFNYGSSWYKEPVVREVPPINEELEVFARAS